MSVTIRRLIVIVILIAAAAIGVRRNRADAGNVDQTGALWLATINDYRTMAGVAPVTDNPRWSLAAKEHARYMVLNGKVAVEQTEGIASTNTGATVASRANVAGFERSDQADGDFIDAWMASPFHALGILRPELKRVGFGSWRDATAQPVGSAAVIDVIDGLVARTPGHSTYQWPGPGSVLSQTAFRGGTLPDPLSACPASFTPPTGLPIIATLHDGELLANSRLMVNDTTVEHCVLSAATYINPDSNSQRIGRAILAADDAVILVARHEFAPGDRIAVSLLTSSASLNWSFGIAAGPQRPTSPASRDS